MWNRGRPISEAVTSGIFFMCLDWHSLNLAIWFKDLNATVSHGSLSFPGLAWTFTLLPSKLERECYCSCQSGVHLCKMLQLLLNKRICHYERLLRSGHLPLHAAQVSDEARFHLTEYSSSQYLLLGCGKWLILCIKLLYMLKVLECDVWCFTIFFIDIINSEKSSDIGHECLGQCIWFFFYLLYHYQKQNIYAYHQILKILT